MKLIKNGLIISLPNENHAEAYLKSGWEKYEEPADEQVPKTKPVGTKKK